MSGKKLVFKMVPGEELSKGFGSSVYWPDFFRFQSVKKVKLVQLEKEDEAIELPIRLCGNNIARDVFFCIRNEEGNALKVFFLEINQVIQKTIVHLYITVICWSSYQWNRSL